MNQITKFSFQLQAQIKSESNSARAGLISTAHGVAQTPMFMGVGTKANVKALTSEDLITINPQVLLANTYHLHLRPGEELVAKLGGLHRFMRYPRPMLTDSGGFQVFSLGKQLQQDKNQRSTANLKPSKISEDGVLFYSHLDGSEHLLTPEKSIQIQQKLGADIIMAFDECLPDDVSYQEAEASVDQTFRWAKRCVTQWEKEQRHSDQGHYQALFGIIQGARFHDLRLKAAQQLSELPFDGLALGGETIGYNMAGTREVMQQLERFLPVDQPRYAMGLGRDPQNVIDAVQVGFDMFDCVAPTRLARNGSLYYGELAVDGNDWRWVSPYKNGRLQIGNAQFKDDDQPIRSDCDCETCRRGYTRAYLHHLFRNGGELTYYRLASIHNLRTLVRLTEQLREIILSK